MLERVHMPEPAYQMRRYPHQLSGGMQQRVVIAMALILRPELVIMDEPTTGLDATIEAGVIDLINDLRRELNMAVLFISHNLGVIARLCDRVGVMYAGEMVEGSLRARFVLRSAASVHRKFAELRPAAWRGHTGGRLITISGRVPSLTDLPPGCAFASRRRFADFTCNTLAPESAAHARAAPRALLSLGAIAAGARQHHRNRRDRVCHGGGAGVVLQVENLHVYYQQSRGFLRNSILKVIDGVSFQVRKRTHPRCSRRKRLWQKHDRGRNCWTKPCDAGPVYFAKRDFTLPIERRDTAALRQLQMVFQNPDLSLNPLHTVEQILARPLRCFQVVPRSPRTPAHHRTAAHG